jgi:transposase-like protein
MRTCAPASGGRCPTPTPTVQTYVVHLIRNSLRYAPKKDWSAVTAGLKPVYTAPTIAATSRTVISTSCQLRPLPGRVFSAGHAHHTELSR